MNVLIADKFEQAGLEGLKGLGAAVVYEPGAGAEGLAGAIAKARPDVLVVRSSKVQRPAMEAAPALRAIVRAGSGVDNIDVPAASALGIAVANCPGMNAVAVAELTMGLLIACDRRIADQTADARAGAWNKKEYARARGLKGSTLGVVGLGAIGREVIKRARAFEMEIVAWSRSLEPAEAKRLGVRPAGSGRPALLKLAGQCDAVTVHVALTDETRALCDREFFAALRPGAIFINTSRGGVVDEAALREAVKSRGLRCGLDVYDGQPSAAQGAWAMPLAELRGCAFTHHCGASTDQAQSAVSDEVVRLVKVFKETGRLENCVNAQAIAGRVRAPLPV
jgi:D-3-phosphoglycerate dehydrogenase